MKMLNLSQISYAKGFTSRNTEESKKKRRLGVNLADELGFPLLGSFPK